MKLPVRLTYAHASLFRGDQTLWWSEHKSAARMWINRLATIPDEEPFLELRENYKLMARMAGQWARENYDRCVEEYLANG